MTKGVEDGRVARGQRTRDAVMDALEELHAEGNLTPTIEEIADRVGRTTRAIYHHFRDQEALARAMAGRIMERNAQLLEAAPVTGTRAERIDGIVAHRAELFEAVAPNRRSALVRMHLSPELQSQQEFLADHLRRQVRLTFAPELSALDDPAASDALEVLDLHTSWETWERLRTWQGLSVERSRLLVTHMVTQALTP